MEDTQDASIAQHQDHRLARGGLEDLLREALLLPWERRAAAVEALVLLRFRNTESEHGDFRISDQIQSGLDSCRASAGEFNTLRCFGGSCGIHAGQCLLNGIVGLDVRFVW